MKNKTSDKKNIQDEKVSEFLEYLISKGGPEPHEYEKLTSIVNDLGPDDIEEFREKISFVLNDNTLMGHAFIKPYGYSGDFMLIDKIYHFSVSNDIMYRNWDHFFHIQPAAEAVRNRKSFFLEYCKKLVKRKKNAKVLVLGSGPATDVYEFLSGYKGDNKINFDLIDFDQNAIDFSMKKNEKFNGSISFNRINSLRFNPFKLYDLIWSAGMFDYFKDKHFIFLIKKYFNCLSDDGEMVISNFSTKNPTRKLMEIMGDWHLNLRTESDLFHISSEAGVDKEMVSIDKEPLGINLFLKIKKN